MFLHVSGGGGVCERREKRGRQWPEVLALAAEGALEPVGGESIAGSVLGRACLQHDAGMHGMSMAAIQCHGTGNYSATVHFQTPLLQRVLGTIYLNQCIIFWLGGALQIILSPG
jgi:hypothetical protein